MTPPSARSALQQNEPSLLFSLHSSQPHPQPKLLSSVRLAGKKQLAIHTISFPKRHNSLLNGQETILKETWLLDRNRSQEDEVDKCLDDLLVT